MKLIFLFSLLFNLYICEFPFPDIANKTLYIINDIKRNETFEVSFYKAAYVHKLDMYFFENTNKKTYLPGWQFEYYIIETGNLFQARFSKYSKKEESKLVDVDFSHPIFVRNTSRYGKHVYVDYGVKLRYKVWSTNNTIYDGSKYLITNDTT